jgi:hypothetical protein
MQLRSTLKSIVGHAQIIQKYWIDRFRTNLYLRSHILLPQAGFIILPDTNALIFPTRDAHLLPDLIFLASVTD